MADCVFCRIAASDIPAQLIYQDDRVVAFRDLNPQAPVHVLLIPREHVVSVAESDAGHEPLFGSLFSAAREVARAEGVEQGGYRLVLNSGADAGQSVLHLHLHLLGGRRMTWPPG
jgi:histidine triad (HIT) family protein